MSIPRRTFIQQSLAAGAGMSLTPQSVNLLTRKPNQLLNVAIMGIRSRGQALAKAFAAQADCEVSYLIEVDERYVADCLSAVAEFQKKVPKVEKDLRTVLEDKSLDALVIAAPDHWHAPAAIMACQAGKHVYVEKPCSHNPREGELLLEAQEKYNRVIQMGNQRRTWSNVQACIQDLHSGIIGKVYYARAWYANSRGPIGFGKEAEIPSYLDFDLWQGPAPRVPYRDNIHPYNWHWFWHWGTGEALNNGTHFLDLMRWGLEVDFPNRVVSTGGRYHYQDDWETPDTQVISIEFEGGKAMTWESRSSNPFREHGNSAGVVFHGEGGTVVLDSGNSYKVYDNERQAKLIKEVTADSGKESQADELNTVGPGMILDMGHIKNFLDGIRKGTSLNSDIEGGHKSVLLCQLGNIAYRTGRALYINPHNGHIMGDTEAMKLWSRTYQKGWEPII